MQLWYDLIDVLIPFKWAEYTFMKNALLGILLVTPMFGMLGTMVINNKMAFFSEALGHSALTGIAIGAVLRINNPMISMIGFSVILAIAIVKVKHAHTASTDTIISVFSSVAVALGIVILSYKGGFSKYSVYLIGDLLSVTPKDLLLLAVTFVGVLILWTGAFNLLLLISINPSLAKSRGISVRLWEYIFTIIIAIIVTLSIPWIGTMIISSMLILPAAAARNIARSVRQYVILSVVIALVSGIIGLILSYFLESASGATIVLILGIVFGITYLIKMKTN